MPAPAHALPTLYTPTEEEVHSNILSQHMRQFNYRFVAEYPLAQPVRLNAKDADGTLLGGIRGFVFMARLRVEVLWVAETARGQGLGARLLAEAEQQARSLGAIGAALDTFEWQAPAFYLKQGYSESGRIERYVDNYALITMQKRFAV